MGSENTKNSNKLIMTKQLTFPTPKNRNINVIIPKIEESEKNSVNVESLDDPNKKNDCNQQLSETSLKFQHYLKFLYKNNFVSLAFDDLSAFLIQYHWRRFFIEEENKKKIGIIDVIYSSILDQSKFNNILNILDSKKYPYRRYDLIEYNNLSEFLKNLNIIDNLPVVFINGFYIGSYEEFQKLEDSELVDKILAKDYEDTCLSCHIPKCDTKLDTCPFCFQKYNYFILIEENFDIWKIRK